MKRNRTQNTCVRISRDGVQIQRSKELLADIGHTIENYSRILKLAANDVRMKILVLLEEEGRLCVCDLSEILDMKIPAVSQHLRKMKDGGLVDAERDGATVYYFIHPKYKPVLDALFGNITESAVL